MTLMQAKIIKSSRKLFQRSWKQWQQQASMYNCTGRHRLPAKAVLRPGQEFELSLETRNHVRYQPTQTHPQHHRQWYTEWQSHFTGADEGNDCLVICENQPVNVHFPSVLGHCWLGDRKGIQPVKSWVLVCWWWWFDCSIARLIAPVVTTASIILCINKHQLTQVHLENGR